MSEIKNENLEFPKFEISNEDKERLLNSCEKHFVDWPALDDKPREVDLRCQTKH